MGFPLSPTVTKDIYIEPLSLKYIHLKLNLLLLYWTFEA